MCLLGLCVYCVNWLARVRYKQGLEIIGVDEVCLRVQVVYTTIPLGRGDCNRTSGAEEEDFIWALDIVQWIGGVQLSRAERGFRNRGQRRVCHSMERRVS